MILGQGVGTAASIAIDDKVSIQDVNGTKLSNKLIELEQNLTQPQQNPN